MDEQTTIRAALGVAREWGPLWVTIVGFVIFKIIEKWKFKRRRFQFNESDRKRDSEIEKLRIDKGKILTELGEHKLECESRIANIRVELEKRITFNWMEGKVLPKIDILTETVNKLSVVVGQDQNNVRLLTESIPKLTSAIENMNEKGRG